MLVSTGWLEQHLHDSNLVILQVSRDHTAYDGWAHPGPPIPGRLTPRPRPEVVVDINAVRDLSYAATNAPAASPVLVDARTHAEFAGTTTASAEIPQPGHIPGATNVYWMQRQAGYDTHLYDGSFSQWSAAKDSDVQK